MKTNGIRLNLDQNDAGLEGGRRTNEKLTLTLQTHRPHFDLRHKPLHLDEDDDGCRNRYWRGGMEDYADRAVVGIRVDGVNVRHLDESEQGQKGQTHQHHNVGGRPYATSAGHPWVKCGQTKASLQQRLTSRIHIV